MSGAAVVAFGLALLVPVAGRAQDGAELERRLAEADAERVAFRFDVSEDVTVCSQGFRRGDETDGSAGWSGNREDRCDRGALEVVVQWRSGRVVDLELGAVGFHPSEADVGAVDSGLAAAWLMTLAHRDAETEASERALAAATVARDVEPAPRLLDLARDRSLHRGVRRAALFWVSQIAADGIGIDTSLAGIAADEGDDQEVRDAAVFALSRRPADEAVAALMDLVRTAPHSRTRRTALFWLAQSDDDRVPDFFAGLIHGSGG